MARTLALLLLLTAPGLARGIARRDDVHAALGNVSGKPNASTAARSGRRNAAKLAEDRWSNASNADEANQTFALLTSIFLPEKMADNAHVAELFAAIGTNLRNPQIGEVHVLMEGPCGANSSLAANSSRFCGGNWSPKLKELVRKHVPGIGKADMAKLRGVPAPGGAQPTYKTFFEYAKLSMQGKFVLLSNTDIVFDGTLGLMDKSYLRGGQHGFVLSVTQAPYNGTYKSVFNSECHSAKRCTLWKHAGWNRGGNSWDCYVFHSVPEVLSKMDLAHIDHFMNIGGAEKRAAFQLEAAAGMTLSNPCLHVNAFHWHCRGRKMHFGKKRADQPHDGTGLGEITPCWNCDGVHLAAGEARYDKLCERGHAQDIQDQELRKIVQKPGLTRVCCEAQPCNETRFVAAWRKGPQNLNLCRRASDLECLMKLEVRPWHKPPHHARYARDSGGLEGLE